MKRGTVLVFSGKKEGRGKSFFVVEGGGGEDGRDHEIGPEFIKNLGRCALAELVDLTIFVNFSFRPNSFLLNAPLASRRKADVQTWL